MKKPLKITFISIATVVALLIVIVLSYISYILLSYHRIGDILIEIDEHATALTLHNDEVYSASTYNIGFGAYSQDYTFFLDTGYDDEGNQTCGHYSKALSKEAVMFNVNGAINTISDLNPDFIFFQEVDVKSTRSYNVNQFDLIVSKFSTYDNMFALNFHSPYLPYPLYDMHGSVQAGLTTLSKYRLHNGQRKSYTVSNSLSKFFDLDRCFSYATIKVENGKNLYIVNSHMSAYDKGGKIREKQIQELNEFLQECKKDGDYVIVGGDFNHDLLSYNPDFYYNDETRPFAMTKQAPDWVSYFYDKQGKSPLTEGYKIVAADNNPSCRNNDIEWIPGETFVCVVDGFIVSDNITVQSIVNVQTRLGSKSLNGFAFSDHEPVYIEFILN